MGPTIITTTSSQGDVTPNRFERRTGVLPPANGRGWIALKNGRYQGEFHGRRGFLAATRAAGSTEVLR